MTDEQIKHMVSRFLTWRLPESFNPDGGISFKKTFNEHTAHPMKHEPVGTNLFDSTQAEAMVRYMIEGMPDLHASTPPAPAVTKQPCSHAWYDLKPPHTGVVCVKCGELRTAGINVETTR